MIAFQPALEEIGELPVLRNIRRRQVGMIVDDRLVAGVLVVQLAGGFGFQQEVVVNEGFHGREVVEWRRQSLGRIEHRAPAAGGASTSSTALRMS